MNRWNADNFINLYVRMGCCTFWLQLYYLRWRLRTRGWRCDSLKFQNRQSDNLVYIQHKRLQEKNMAASVFDLNQLTSPRCALCSHQQSCVWAMARRSCPTHAKSTSPISPGSSGINIDIWISPDGQFLTTFSVFGMCLFYCTPLATLVHIPKVKIAFYFNKLK